MFSGPFPVPTRVREMVAREQYYVRTFARYITEAQGTGTATHPCVCKLR